MVRISLMVLITDTNGQTSWKWIKLKCLFNIILPQFYKLMQAHEYKEEQGVSFSK